jgi:hypothetical protein
MDSKETKNPYGPDYAIVDMVIVHSVLELVGINKNLAAEALTEQWKRARRFLDSNLLSQDSNVEPLQILYSTIAMSSLLLKSEGKEKEGSALESSWVRFTESLTQFLLNNPPKN